MLRRTAEYAGTRRHAGRTPDSVVERFLFVKANCAVGFARIPQLLENKVSGLSLTWPVERQVSAQERFDVEIGWLNALGDRLDYRSARNARGRKRPTYSCAGSRVWRSGRGPLIAYRLYHVCRAPRSPAGIGAAGRSEIEA